jgi:hypothetical protein
VWSGGTAWKALGYSSTHDRRRGNLLGQFKRPIRIGSEPHFGLLYPAMTMKLKVSLNQFKVFHLDFAPVGIFLSDGYFPRPGLHPYRTEIILWINGREGMIRFHYYSANTVE